MIQNDQLIPIRDDDGETRLVDRLNIDTQWQTHRTLRLPEGMCTRLSPRSTVAVTSQVILEPVTWMEFRLRNSNTDGQSKSRLNNETLVPAATL
jgi:hypothetical protein